MLPGLYSALYAHQAGNAPLIGSIDVKENGFVLEPSINPADTDIMNAPPKLVIFSDLDGTLLDHDTYQWTAARPALDRLASMEIPVVLASSKTAAEIRLLQADMRLTQHPAIVENGSGIIGLDGENQTPSYTKLRRQIEALPDRLNRRFRGFGDMDAAEVAAVTGLSLDAACRAKARDFSEPGLWSGDEDELGQFQDVLSAHGITAQQGGRFLTLSFGRTKADAMNTIVAALKPEKTMALGDAPNDIDLLQAADFGVLVANPYRPPLPELPGETQGRIIRTTQAGPTGWNTAVNAYLDMLN